MKLKHNFKEVSGGKCTLYKSDNINAAIEVISSRCINVRIYRDESEIKEHYKFNKGENAELCGIEMKLDTDNFLLSFYKDGKRLFADRAPLAYNF